MNSPDSSSLKSKRKIFPLLALFLGIALVAAGAIFNPSFVAGYVKHVETLHPLIESKVLSYQLYAITLGFLLIFASALVYGRKYGAVLFLPLLVVYALVVYVFYIDKRHPGNIFLEPSSFVKVWHVLSGEELVLSDYQPRSTLEVKNREVRKPRYPVIDIHSHFNCLSDVLDAEELVKIMDASGIDKLVNLDGGPARLEGYVRDYASKYPDRFIMFTKVEWHKIDEPDFPESQIAWLEKAVGMGARGLKVWKDLGLQIKDESGRLVPIDDPRLDPIWAKAGELGIPVLMHTADPTPFFRPGDRFNERYEEIQRFPEWGYYSPYFPDKEALLRQRENLLKRHPETVFIGAHMGMNAEDLGYVGRLLDEYPNYYVDMSSAVHELGRQPYTAREFFIKYQDRILFGADCWVSLGTEIWPIKKYYGAYYEFLETENEYFDYPLYGLYSQGRWKVYGINLPDEVLEKIYYKNAAKVLGLSKVSYLKQND